MRKKPIKEVSKDKNKTSKTTDPVPEICIKKCDKFPKCEPCGSWFDRMK